MVRTLSASAFAETTVINSFNVDRDTPFGSSASKDKLDWAIRQLEQLRFSDRDVLELQINLHGGPSVATYMAWLHQAMAETNQDTKYRLQTKKEGNFLYIRKVEKIASGKGSRVKVKHVIS